MITAAVEITSLEGVEFGALHEAWCQAFSDYLVPMRPAPDALYEMLLRRGWEPELSCAVWADRRIVAFTANGIGLWPDAEGAPVVTAYDAGTGVAPSHRRQHLGRVMLEHLAPRLRSAGAKQYLLEVLTGNAPAVALYRSAGFRPLRELQCWTLPVPPVPKARITMAPLDAASEARLVEASDLRPSWQNSRDSLGRSGDHRLDLAAIRNGSVVGSVSVYPSTGDLPQLVVARHCRREGIGTALLAAAAETAGRPLRLINVDASDDGVAAFLRRAGATETLRQYEMVRTL